MSGTTINADFSMSKFNIKADENTGKIVANNDLGGLNTEILMEAHDIATQAKLKTPQDKIDNNIAVKNALDDLETKIRAFKAAGDNLKGITLDTLEENGIFSYFVPTMTSNGAESPEKYVNIIAENRTDPTSFSMHINRIATQDIAIAANDAAVDEKTVLNWTGNIQLPNVKEGEADIIIDFEESMTLSTLQKTINNQKAHTGVVAKIIPSETGVKLGLQALETGSPLIFTIFSNGNDDPMPVSSGKTEEELSAEIEYFGQTLMRTSNEFSIDNVQFKLLKAQPVNEKINVDISHSTVEISNAIQAWVDTHNDLIDFIAEQSKVSADGKRDENAVLLTNPTLMSTQTMLNTKMTNSVPGVNKTQYDALSKIGITYMTKIDDHEVHDLGKLTFSVVDFSKALAKDFDGVRGVFGFESKTSDVNFVVTEHPPVVPNTLMDANNLTTVSISKDVNGDIIATFTNPEINGGDPYTVPASGIAKANQGESVRVKGEAGSDYKDFEILFNNVSSLVDGGPAATATVLLSQGIANATVGEIDKMLDPSTGIFAQQERELTQSSKDLEERKTMIQKAQDMKRVSLETKYAKAMAAIQKALMMIQKVTSLQNELMN